MMVNLYSDKPKVSVLIPVYKTPETYLRECLDSILNQTFSDFEVLLLDDCPEDSLCQKIIESYTDKRIKYFRNETNLGISRSRNKLIDLAKGAYLAVMDHDDISLPERLEKEVAYLDSHPETGVVSCHILKFPQNKICTTPTENHDIKLALMNTTAIVHSAVMIRKSVLTKHNIRYEEEFTPTEDYALWCRLLPYTDFYNIPEVLFKYRYHESNTSILQRKKRDDAGLAIQAFVHTENPALYQEFLLKAETTRKVLFCGIPLFTTVKKQYGRTKGYLFGFLPIFSAKTTQRLK